jgi:chromosome segregation ATPase
MDDKDLKTQVKQIVADLFNEKEEAKIRQRTEAELEKAAASISGLTDALETKNVEFSEMEEKVGAYEEQVEALKSELEAARTELETANKSLSEKELELSNIMKDRAAEKRMVELEDAGVIRSSRDSQMKKVREMSEEDFASYKEELVSIRESVLKELEKAIEDNKTDKDTQVEEETAGESVDDTSQESEEASDETHEDASEEEDIEPAQISPGRAAMAALNMEYLPNTDIMKKYSELGKAMAKRFTKSD